MAGALEMAERAASRVSRLAEPAPLGRRFRLDVIALDFVHRSVYGVVPVAVDHVVEPPAVSGRDPFHVVIQGRPTGLYGCDVRPVKRVLRIHHAPD